MFDLSADYSGQPSEWNTKTPHYGEEENILELDAVWIFVLEKSKKDGSGQQFTTELVKLLLYSSVTAVKNIPEIMGCYPRILHIIDFFQQFFASLSKHNSKRTA